MQSEWHSNDILSVVYCNRMEKFDRNHFKFSEHIVWIGVRIEEAYDSRELNGERIWNDCSVSRFARHRIQLEIVFQSRVKNHLLLVSHSKSLNVLNAKLFLNDSKFTFTTALAFKHWFPSKTFPKEYGFLLLYNSVLWIKTSLQQTFIRFWMFW